MERIGFIGLGIMGRPMALNLIKAGHRLAVWARRQEAAAPLSAAGARTAASPRELAAASDIVFTIVSDTPDVEQVLFGDLGVIHGIAPGSVVVDCSTISPAATRDMAVRLAERGVEMLDAPVSGGEVGAIQGTLSIMAGGNAEVFQRVQPLLACLGKNIVHVGESGAGQVAKACNQILAAVTIEGVAEALSFAARAGTDPAKVREALLGGFAYSRVLEFHGQRMLEGDYRPGFRSRLFQKDLRIVLDSAHQMGLALPAAAVVAQHFNAMAGAGEGDLDGAGLYRVIERLSRKGQD
jgi:2-hydroxy-3-oxopropionate reductase